jgi:hypothetical protein
VSSSFVSLDAVSGARELMSSRKASMILQGKQDKGKGIRAFQIFPDLLGWIAAAILGFKSHTIAIAALSSLKRAQMPAQPPAC